MAVAHGHRDRLVTQRLLNFPHRPLSFAKTSAASFDDADTLQQGKER
jgi:hypothetical protein